MTMMVNIYPSKKVLKEQVGRPLQYVETSMFGLEYKADGNFVVAHRPVISRMPGREFFAEVTMENGLIKAVS